MLRNATIGDIPELVRLEETCFDTDRIDYKEFIRYLLDSEADVFLIDEGTWITGSVVLLPESSNTIRIYSLCSITGKGKDLLKEVEARAFEKGKRYISLEVKVNSFRAIMFYRRNGFNIESAIPRFYEDGTDAIVMIKRLRYDND